MIARRRLLFAAGAAGALWVSPTIALARAAGERRFVFVLQRGAADGLDVVAPTGDPDYARLRSAIDRDPSARTRLDSAFALHPALRRTAELYAKGEAAFVHAVASDYRDRSHFDGQNVLETGGAAPYARKDGWLNRLAGLAGGGKAALALAPTVPMALRGEAAVTSYAPSALPEAPDDLLARVERLYAADPQLHPLWAEAMAARALASGDDPAGFDPASVGKLAASFLAQADGPRIAMLETGGWDTHAGQVGRLQRQLAGLDQLIGALRDSLGPLWADTTVLVATEFGRTAAANGAGGTDHGTASVAWLVGGAVQGGRVVADWPGLSQAALYEGRDLRSTRSLNAVIAGVAAEALALDPERTARTLFAPGLAPASGLVRA